MSVPLPDAQWPLFQRMARCAVRVENARSGNIGTGVVISEHGLILTAQHVVTGCNHARIRRCRLDDEGWDLVTEGRYTADVILEDKNADISVLLMRKPPKRLNVAKIGDSTSLRIGETVYRVGLDEHRMDGGHVITLAKTTVVSGRRLRIPEIAVSMRSDVGASGGPLFDADLDLVGISLRVSSDKSAPSISYCIPIHSVVRRLFRRTAITPYLPDTE